MSNVAAAAHAPFIAAADSKMFGLEGFSQLGEPRDLAKIFDSVEYAKWKSFRESRGFPLRRTVPAARADAPALRQRNVPVESFNFEEDVDGTDHKKYLWGNAAYLAGDPDHRRVREARLVHGDPRRRGRRAGRGPADAHLPHRRGRRRPEVPDRDCDHRPPRKGARRPRVHSAGPLQGTRLRGVLLDAVGQQAQEIRLDDFANANARLSSQLQYIFAISRFAHYLKAMMRDKVGSFMSRKNCEDFLNTLDHPVRAARRRREPRAEGEVAAARGADRGRRGPGKPGRYRAIAYLRPHFQLDELDVSLRLVADLPPPEEVSSSRRCVEEDGMPFDAFLKIATVPGESTDDKHKEWIEVLSYSWGVSQTTGGLGELDGRARGQRADISDFSFVQPLDKASPKLFWPAAPVSTSAK